MESITVEVNGRRHVFQTREIKHRRGLYLVVVRVAGGYCKIYVGESEDIKDRIDNHDSKKKACWKSYGHPVFLGLYYPHSKLVRQQLEQAIIRKYKSRYELPCNL